MDIVMIPFHDCKKWLGEGFRTRDAHLAEHFSKDKRIGKVLVINRPVSLAEVVLKRSSWRTSRLYREVEKVSAGKDCEIGKLKGGLYCLDIFLPDFFKVAREKKLWWFSAFQNKFVLNAINNAISELKLKDTILLLQNPMAVGAVGSIPYHCFAFDAIDNWLYHPQMISNRSVIKENYKFVEEKAEVIFTVSKALMGVFEQNPSVNWMANGVDTDFFSSAINKHRLNQQIKIGYVGKIQDRVDFNLVETCLERFPAMKFVFMGPIYSQKKRIKEIKRKHSNIEFTGDIHYKNLPNALREIDVAIIPHTVDAFTDSMNPLKLYEYLAAGKPVVTTGVAGTENISSYVYVANGSEFVNQLGDVCDAVRGDGLDPIKIATSIPKECTWTYRVNEIIEILESAEFSPDREVLR